MRVVCRPRARLQIGMSGYLDFDGAPRAIMFFVRGPVSQTVNLAQVFNDLIVDIVKVFDLARFVIESTAFVGEQGQGLTSIFINPLEKLITGSVAFRVEIDGND